MLPLLETLSVPASVFWVTMIMPFVVGVLPTARKVWPFWVCSSAVAIVMLGVTVLLGPPSSVAVNMRLKVPVLVYVWVTCRPAGPVYVWMSWESPPSPQLTVYVKLPA